MVTDFTKEQMEEHLIYLVEEGRVHPDIKEASRKKVEAEIKKDYPDLFEAVMRYRSKKNSGAVPVGRRKSGCAPTQDSIVGGRAKCTQ